MDPMIAIGLASAGVDAFDSLKGASSARQYKYQRRLQKHQFEFQERMANTAHQREKADLIAAGMNPTLTATGGAGAATPSGGMGSVGMQDMDFSDSVSSAAQIKQREQELRQQRDLIDSQIDKNRADASYAEAAAGAQRSNERLNEANEKLANAQYDAQTARNVAAENDARIENTWYGRNIAAPLRSFSRAILGADTVVNSAASLKNANTNRMNAEFNTKPQTNVTRTYDRKGRHVSTRTSTTAR